MGSYLTGAGHFGIGFSIGFFTMVMLCKQFKRNINIQLYMPFLPFVIGLYSALPYLFFGAEHSASWLNIFMLYDALHQNATAIKLFGRLHLVAITCAFMYLYILLRYIALVKHCRRYGWKKVF